MSHFTGHISSDGSVAWSRTAASAGEVRVVTLELHLPGILSARDATRRAGDAIHRSSDFLHASRVAWQIDLDLLVRTLGISVEEVPRGRVTVTPIVEVIFEPEPCTVVSVTVPLVPDQLERWLRDRGFETATIAPEASGTFLHIWAHATMNSTVPPTIVAFQGELPPELPLFVSVPTSVDELPAVVDGERVLDEGELERLFAFVAINREALIRYARDVCFTKGDLVSGLQPIG